MLSEAILLSVSIGTTVNGRNLAKQLISLYHCFIGVLYIPGAGWKLPSTVFGVPLLVGCWLASAQVFKQTWFVGGRDFLLDALAFDDFSEDFRRSGDTYILSVKNHWKCHFFSNHC